MRIEPPHNLLSGEALFLNRLGGIISGEIPGNMVFYIIIESEKCGEKEASKCVKLQSL